MKEFLPDPEIYKKADLLVLVWAIFSIAITVIIFGTKD